MSKTTKKCQGHEYYQRLNYLRQISEFACNHLGSSSVSAYYGNLINSLAKKTMIKIDSNIKRHMCKRCKVALIPGKTVSVKSKSKKGKSFIHWKCLNCGFVKRYPINSKHKLWSERPESTVELLEYSSEKKNNKQNC